MDEARPWSSNPWCCMHDPIAPPGNADTLLKARIPHMVCASTDFNRRCEPPPHNNEDGHSRHIANLRRGSHRAWRLWTATLAGLPHRQASAARTACGHDAGGKLSGCVTQKGHPPRPPPLKT